MSTVDHVAAADCERCRKGPIAQPVNTVSSLAFTVAGLALVARARRRQPPDAPVGAGTAETALGWSAVAAGLGSVAYHGPGTRPGRILHDASLITMLGALIVADVSRVTSRPPSRVVLAALPGVATAAAMSPWSLPAQVVVGAGASVAEVARVRRSRTGTGSGWQPIAESLVAAGGALGHLFGRTGGPLCRPDSIWQAHAAWHTAMAVVLVLRE
ncbi:MAG TPA: hypothetical protein VFN21_12145 [Acidimicrobiales bacterium]|nr:hypothetical protein [Acidimicrobiales bacterium]